MNPWEECVVSSRCSENASHCLTFSLQNWMEPVVIASLLISCEALLALVWTKGLRFASFFFFLMIKSSHQELWISYSQEASKCWLLLPVRIGKIEAEVSRERVCAGVNFPVDSRVLRVMSCMLGVGVGCPASGKTWVSFHWLLWHVALWLFTPEMS